MTACACRKSSPNILAMQPTQHRTPPGASVGRWDRGLVCDFDTFEGLQTYSHPSHLEAVKKLLPMFLVHAIFDFEFDPSKQNV